MPILEIYADGGVEGSSRSSVCGAWAFCFVNEAGNRVFELGGIATPTSMGLPDVTNNQTEMLAAINALKAVPRPWAGVLRSDSNITLGRLFAGWHKGDSGWCREMADDSYWELNGLPGWVIVEIQALRPWILASGIRGELLDGHPTSAQLATGIGKRGSPVSKHNVWCDQECQRQIKAYVRSQRGAASSDQNDMFSSLPGALGGATEGVRK